MIYVRISHTYFVQNLHSCYSHILTNLYVITKHSFFPFFFYESLNSFFLMLLSLNVSGFLRLLCPPWECLASLNNQFQIQICPRIDCCVNISICLYYVALQYRLHYELRYFVWQNVMFHFGYFWKSRTLFWNFVTGDKHVLLNNLSFLFWDKIWKHLN